MNVLKRLASGAKNKNIVICTIDLSVFDGQQKSFLKSVSTEFKNIDILINTAGSIVVKDFMKFSNDRAREMMEINFFGPASVIRTVRPLMKKGAHIVNISSMGGLSYYSASKAALSCLSECLAEELKGNGIAINCLALGAVQTEMFEEAFPRHKAPVSAKEMAQFIVYFSMNGNKYFNGKVLPVTVGNP
jgi:3-oxoacyl-[acyl-carrier protein] reductase